ncbi:MAG: hypothetical protein U9Q29_02885 [Campylobacterota bacterium]|nr:hypothetical protein [Campylobacterota bacterium]
MNINKELISEVFGVTINSVEAETEPEAIFKACEWIMKQNNKTKK